MRSILLLVALGLGAGCKDKPKEQPQTGSGSGSGSGSALEVKVDWAKCDAALAAAATAPLDARPKILLDGCEVCGGDWKTLLDWNVDPEKGGPRREHIEQMMVACKAFCTGDSKLKFMSGVDKVRGQNVDTPWRLLATTCKHMITIGDTRFMTAAYFALDRIAREVGAHSGSADKLAAIEIPLPPLTISGVGVALPDADAVTPTIGALHLTVLGKVIYVGRMPRGKLTAGGVPVELGPSGYPGEAVKIGELPAKLKALIGDDKTQTITLLAPREMPAIELVPIIAAASKHAPVFLGAKAVESPTGWELAGAIPIALEAGTDIKVSGEMTVQNLARELSARKQNRVGVTKQ